MEIKIISLTEVEFSFWNTQFQKFHPNSMENFTRYFSAINDKFPVSEERAKEYIRVMKEVLSKESNFTVMEKEFRGLKGKYHRARIQLERRVTEVSRAVEAINRLVVKS
jgi:hypothetical protein